MGPATGVLGYDARSYWGIDLRDPYASARASVDAYGAFRYAPAIAQVMAPFGVLPWPVFLVGWLALLVAAVVWLGGRWALALLALPPVAFELVTGNINLLLAVAIVLGFRWPAAWAFVLLTKVAPGIGLLWFAVRREWRNLFVAVAATAGVVAVSYLLAPHLWTEWIGYLTSTASRAPTTGPYLPIPLIVRLPVAAAVVAWGALTDRRWTVPVAATLAIPILWINGLSVLAAVVPLVDRTRGSRSRTDGPEGKEEAD